MKSVDREIDFPDGPVFDPGENDLSAREVQRPGAVKADSNSTHHCTPPQPIGLVSWVKLVDRVFL